MNNKDKAHIIAEAGVNHNGKMDYAKQLIQIASKSGADSIKFQIINPYGLYLPGEYKYGHYDIKEVLKNRFSTVLTDEQYTELNHFSKELGIDFSGSIFDEKGLNLLASFNPPYIKVASCDLNNIRLLRQIAERGIKMILSTGMSTLNEIEKSLNVLAKENFDNIVLLHCVSIYPCPVEKTNVSFIRILQDTFGYDVGFSDHTRTTEAAVVAYALGARWFEKHFTFDNSLEGFDHKHAQNEEEFTYYISALRSIEKSLSQSDKKISKAEKYTSERARRSLYASQDLKKGKILTDKDIICVRPSAIMNANEIDILIGKKLTEDIKQYSPYSHSHISNDTSKNIDNM